MLAPPDPDAWTQQVRDALARYPDAMLRRAAGSLFKPKIGQPPDELVERVADTQFNAPVIDRRLNDLPDSSRHLLALVGRSRQPRWAVGHLVALSAAVGYAEGFGPVQALLDGGLLFPDGWPAGPVSGWDDWLGLAGGLPARVFAHPAVMERARADRRAERREPPGEPATAGESDGLEWPLRLAAVWQQVRASPVRLTQASALFKRDFVRLQADPVLSAPLAEVGTPIPDAGLLAFEWATAAGLFRDHDGERSAAPIGDTGRSLWAVLGDLYAAFFAVPGWCPARGAVFPENGLSDTPTAALLCLVMLADGGSHAPAELAAWLWEHHPSWAGSLPKEAQRESGTGWVATFLGGVAYPLRVVESADGRYRLSAFGRHLLLGGPEPPTPATFPQTLVVQPNAEVLAYRQGLTPGLIAELSRFAAWKGIGPACTLELNEAETYRGLESGLTLAAIRQTLDRHGTRPVPANVADLLRRWADKRERVMVYPSATLVEFAAPADLDAALARGIVAVRVTDRIGLTADGSEPEFKHLRLVGNRDYEAKPQQCVTVAPDGVTLTVDPVASDLLLEAELVRLADPLPAEGNGRKFSLTPASVRRAAESGLSADDLDGWFRSRAGVPFPPAARLFVGPVRPLAAEPLTVLRVPSAEVADGLVQWPATAGFIEDRLGPTALVVEAANVAALADVLRGIGIEIA